MVKRGEFPLVNSKDKLAKGVEKVLASPETVSRSLANSRTAHWHGPSGTLVIHNPNAPDLGTVFRPTEGVSYFNKLK